MTKKRKHRSKLRKKRARPKPPDAVYEFGPIRLEQSGRFVALSSHWPPGEFEKYIARVKAHQEPFRKEITDQIQELITIMRECSPLELLSVLAFKNVFANPETYTESTHKGRECYVEYALSLALSISDPKLEINASEDAIGRMQELIAKTFNDVGWFFATERLQEGDETESEVRYQSIMRYLMVRGDAYPEHFLDLVRGLFAPHDSFFQASYGFCTNDLIGWIEQIEAQLTDALFSQLAFFSKLRETHKIYQAFVDERGIGSFDSLEQCIREFDSLQAVQSKKTELDELHSQMSPLFHVKPHDQLPKEFLELVSARFGDNEEFVSFAKSPAWPTNDSIVFRRSIISFNDAYYCFAPQILYRNLIQLLEDLIREKDEKYFLQTFQKARARYLVHQTARHLTALLPGASVFQELFYPFPDNEKTKRSETDLLVVYDTNLLIVECKAGSLTTPSKRGALSRLKRDLSELVDKAYDQALRTKTYIETTDEPRFEHENGSEALVLKDKKQFGNVYLLNVTLDSLAHLSSQLGNLKKLNLINGKEWPWSVSLPDLRVISELVESPSEFLVYLKRRIRANDYPQFRLCDELDFFMYYLKDGLYFEDGRLGREGSFGLHAYTERLDRWYDFQAGRVSSGEKPRLEIPEDYKTLIKGIEATQKAGFSDVTTTLLDFDVEAMEVILENIRQGKAISLRDGRDHDLTLEFEKSSLGLTILVSTNQQSPSIARAAGYALMRKYQLKYEKWILLIADATDETNPYDFRYFSAPWRHDAQKEEEVERYRQRKLEQHFAQFGKPGRNDPCPCNSTLKYKKCCGNKS
jgi:uncharacterized protein YchJ